MLFSKTRFNPEDFPDLTGKVIVVTGANAGLGFAVIQHLVGHGAKIYMCCRNEQKARAAIDGLDLYDSDEVCYLHLDLSDPKEAQAAAEEYMHIETRLDILINNAAQTLIPYARTMYDIQDVMVVNYLSQVVFTQSLLPILTKTAQETDSDVRIINISSESPMWISPGQRFRNKEDFNQEFADSFLPKFSRYGFSKLALLLWTNELQCRLLAHSHRIIVMSVDPGAVYTDGHSAFAQTWGWFMRRFLDHISWAIFPGAREGSLPLVFAAVSPVIREKEEAYFGGYITPSMTLGCPPGKDAGNLQLRKELWTTTFALLDAIGVRLTAI